MNDHEQLSTVCIEVSYCGKPQNIQLTDSLVSKLSHRARVWLCRYVDKNGYVKKWISNSGMLEIGTDAPEETDLRSAIEKNAEKTVSILLGRIERLTPRSVHAVSLVQAKSFVSQSMELIEELGHLGVSYDTSRIMSFLDKKKELEKKKIVEKFASCIAHGELVDGSEFDDEDLREEAKFINGVIARARQNAAAIVAAKINQTELFRAWTLVAKMVDDKVSLSTAPTRTAAIHCAKRVAKAIVAQAFSEEEAKLVYVRVETHHLFSAKKFRKENEPDAHRMLLSLELSEAMKRLSLECLSVCYIGFSRQERAQNIAEVHIAHASDDALRIVLSIPVSILQ